MLPRLSDLFSLVELPRIADVPVDQRVVLPHSQKSLTYQETDFIHLGMSKLLISSYVLKPTPKLVWSFPLSSSTIVDGMDVKDNLYAVGLSERRKHLVKLVKRYGNDESSTADYPVPQAAVGVMFGSGSSIYVFSQSGALEHLEYQESKVEGEESKQISLTKASLLSSLPALPRSSEHKVIYHTFITEHAFQHKSSLLFYITRLDKLDSYTCRLVGLDEAKTFEIYSITYERPGLDTCLFTYADGVLYTFDKTTKLVSSASLMKPQNPIKTVSLAPLFTKGKNDYGFYAPASDRLLISSLSKLFLVNFKFESLLDQFEHDPQVKLHFNFALPTKGNSTSSSSTYALYLGFNEKRKTSKLNYIQVEVGKNTLRESLGKSISSLDKSKQALKSYPALLSTSLPNASKRGNKELDDFLESLTKKNDNTDAFNEAIIKFFKGEEYKDRKTYSHSINDKIIDALYLERILALIFKVDEKESTVQIQNESFIPEAAVAYLLSHPLYPTEYANGLLLLFSQLNEPELLKTAIEKCPALSIDDLTNELNNLTELADELDKDSSNESLAQLILMFLGATIDRLVNNFSLPQITKKLQEILTAEYDGYSKKLERMLGVFININTTQSWDLVQAVIDAGGLFNWSIPVIEKLGLVIDSKVEALGANSYNLTLTNQALQADNNKKQNKKKSTSKASVVDNIHEIGTQKEELDALLTMSNGTTNQKLRVDEGIELAKRIPAYSREKLVL